MSGPSLSLSLDTQIYAFAEIGKLEQRVLEIEGLVAQLKRRCLGGGAGSLSELVSATADLRWQLRDAATHLVNAEHHLGIRGRAAPHLPEEPPTEPRIPSCLRGTTDCIAIPDLIHLLSALKKTGSLSIQSGETLYVLEFLEGAIVHAVTNHRGPEWRLGTILVAQNKITPQQLEASLDAVARTHEMLGTQLTRTSIISESDLRAALELQVCNMFESIFAIGLARFTFLDGSISNLGQRVSLNTTQLLLDTARRRDEETKHRDVLTEEASARAAALDANIRESLSALLDVGIGKPVTDSGVRRAAVQTAADSITLSQSAPTKSNTAPVPAQATLPPAATASAQPITTQATAPTTPPITS